MQSLQKQVGARLKTLREERGLSQEALAGVCNLHRTYIGLIERGERSLSLPTIELIAQALEIPPATLFEGVESVPASGRDGARKQSAKAPDVVAHIAAIRQILIEANLVNERRYTEILKSHQTIK